MMRRIIQITLMLAFVIGGGSCSKPGNLSLEITYPMDEAVLGNNLLKLSGIVSDPTANVTISYGTSQIGTTISENGSFYAWVDLPKGASMIEVLATKKEEKAERKMTVTFAPPLAVYLDFVSSNVTDKPTTVTGYVNEPKAKVTVNGVLAEVKRDGSYSAQIFFKKGNNTVVAEAVLGQEVDSESFGFEITPEGFILPPRGVGPRAGFGLTSTNVSLKAGETKSVEATFKAEKNVRLPGQFVFKLSRITDKSFSGVPIPEELKAPMPDGLEIFLEPNNFNVWPNATYSPKLIIKATNQVIPGDYWFAYEYQGTGVLGGSVFSVVVEPS